MKTKFALGVLLAAWVAVASASTDPAVVAKAESLLKGADDKLAAANTLHAVYTETDEYPGEYRDLRQIGTLTVERPNHLRLEIVRARRVKPTDPWKDSGNTTLTVADGKQSNFAFFHAESTQVRTSEGAETPKLAEAPLLAGFFTGNYTPSVELATGSQNGKVTDVEVEGAKVRFKEGAVERTIELGDDGLVHKLIVDNLQTKARKTWTLDQVVTDSPVASAAFRYEIPQNAIPFPAAEKSAGIALGADAPDFAVDGVAKGSLKLSDFKGKVVVLEFWATWCWPCNQSIPETQRLVSTYRDKGVESFLVSIKDNRKGFDAWIAKHPQYADLKFGFDDPVKGQAYEAFLHPNNPTLYVIGRDGKVLLKTEGYTGPNPEVEKAIQSAL